MQVTFDPKVISYSEILDVYWREFDPTDAGGSFYDRGSQYVSAIFYHDGTQRAIAEATKQLLDRSGRIRRAHRDKDPPVRKVLSGGGLSPALLQDQRGPLPFLPDRLGEGRVHRENVGENRLDGFYEAAG